MGVDTLKNFLEQSAKAKAKGKTVDWNKEREDFLAALSEFYAQIKGYLNVFADRVKIEEDTITISEEHLGRYQATQLTLTIDDKTIRLVPIGTILVAAKGRVDMVGPKTTVKFVLVNQHAKSPGFGLSIRVGDQIFEEKAPVDAQSPKWEWKLSTPPPRIKFEPITADSFSDALLAVINGP